MRVPHFYCESLTMGLLELSASEAHHARDVLRLERGEAVILLDGRGGAAQGTAAEISRGRVAVAVTVIDRVEEVQRPSLTIATGVPRAGRQETMVEKCTELGVAAIVPIVSSRSVAKLHGSIEKLRRRALESMKQCGRRHLPRIVAPRRFDEFVPEFATFDAIAIANLCAEAENAASFFRRHACSRVLACVGPEGGWSDDELTMAVSAGAVAVRLGPNVLRTETAAIGLCALFRAHCDA